MLDGVHKIYKEEGLRALYNGCLARILFHMPNVAISMGVIEIMRPKVTSLLDGFTGE